MEKISAPTALERLQTLVGKPIVIEVGYAGVLFCEIGNLKKVSFSRPTVMYQGEARIYSNEYWELRKDGKKVVDRWRDKGEVEQLTVNSIISAIEFKNNMETHIELSSGYNLVIIRKEALETWDVQFDKDEERLEAHGVGDYFLFPHEPKEPTRHTKHLRKEPDDPFFIKMYKENLPLSAEMVKKVAASIINIEVSEVSEYSGVSFTLDFKPSDRWRFSIDSNWKLVDVENNIVLDSVSQRFVYGDELRKHLIGARLVSFTFDDLLVKTELTFSNDYCLILPSEKRQGLWTLFDLRSHYHIWAEPGGKFFHTIVCPGHLMKQYQVKKYGRSLTHLLHALEMYRKWVAL